MNEVFPSVSVKKKSLSSLIDYCIENKIDFSVKSKSSATEDFDVEFLIADTKKAVALGMCLKELKLELNGLSVIPVSAIKAKKQSKENVSSNQQSGTAEGEVTMAFEDALQFDLGSSN